MDGHLESARLHQLGAVQARLGVSRSTVYREMESGRLRSVKVGRRRLVSEAALLDFIAALESVAQ